MSPEELTGSVDGYFDLRHKVYSTNNQNDIDEYLNYLQICKFLALSSTDIRNNHLLQMGYMPVCMPPTFMPWIPQFIVPKLEIPYIERPAVSFNNFAYVGDFNDIWVHKMDCAEILHCKPTEATVKKLLEAIL